ncbi:MAG TPA: putative Ig domain-containing protein, partial [Agitococcus sp.]|nr:putative Ig domain-containing protein [Agitococcus sp.]
EANQGIEIANFAQSDGTGGWVLNTSIANDVVVLYADEGQTELARLTGQQIYDAYIVPQNHAPVLISAPALLANSSENTPYTLLVSDLLQGYADADGDTLSVINLQADYGSFVDNQDGTYTLHPIADFNGVLDLSYQVSDGRGGVIDANNSIVIYGMQHAPEPVIPIGDQIFAVGFNTSFTLAPDTFIDLNGDLLTYSASLEDGTSLPTWLTFDAATQTFSGMPNNDDSGFYRIKVIASDGMLTGSQTFEIHAQGSINRAPEAFIALENQGAKEGQAFNYQLPVDAFVDIDGDLLNYIVSLSDGSPLPDWLTFDYVTQMFSGTPTDNDAGALLIKVMANDGMLSAEQEFTISIEDTPYPWWDDWNNISLANVQVLEGEAAQWQLPVLENPDNVVLNYIATLSDGSALPEWLTFDANTLTFSGTPSFDDAGVLNVTVTITEAEGLSASQVFNL